MTFRSTHGKGKRYGMRSSVLQVSGTFRLTLQNPRQVTWSLLHPSGATKRTEPQVSEADGIYVGI